MWLAAHLDINPFGPYSMKLGSRDKRCACYRSESIGRIVSNASLAPEGYVYILYIYILCGFGLYLSFLCPLYVTCIAHHVHFYTVLTSRRWRRYQTLYFNSILLIRNDELSKSVNLSYISTRTVVSYIVTLYTYKTVKPLSYTC